MLRFFLIILAVLILLSMAGYAISLMLKLRHQQRHLKQAQTARYLNVIESIELIIKAMQQEQCDLSEGVLRLKALLAVLGKNLNRYVAMWALFELVESMPILDERAKLKRNERMKQDLAREAKEAELSEQIQTELTQLSAEITQLKQQLQQK